MDRIRLGLIGDNISKSRAPALHRLAASQLDIELSYDLIIPARQGLDFEECLTHARHLGLSGVNVTLPFKQRAFEQAKIEDNATRNLGAVNTLRFVSSGIIGYNTDYSGFKKAYVTERGTDLPGEVAVIGAGGVGRAIAFALLELGASRLRIVDKNDKQATSLCNHLNSLSTGRACVSSIGRLQGCDAVINCTPAGMSGYGGLPLPEDNFPETCRWVFDAVYTPVDTPFSALAKSRGAKFISGFELFFFQGVDAFHLFTGRQVRDEQALRQALMSSNRMATNK